MTYTIKADTPEQMRDAIVKWLRHEALLREAQIKIGNTKRWKSGKQLEADTLKAAAAFLAMAKIEPTSLFSDQVTEVMKND